MENSHIKNLLGLLLGTFLISTSGVLGRYIALPSEHTILFRAAFAVILLGIYCSYKKLSFRLKSKKHTLPFLIAGVFMAIHWVTYFYALKLSNVAVGMLSLFTFPVIIAFLEPVFLKIKFNPIYIIFGIMVLLGLYILSPTFTFEDTTVQGIICGVVSALTYSVRILIMKKYVAEYNLSLIHI